jgi:beta-glucosidase
VATVSPDSKKLVRFSKINIGAGEVKTVKFTINSGDLASIGINNKWITEEGEFEIQVGGNSKELLIKPFYFK